MPFAIGGNQLDTGYEVSNSLRFNANNDRLERTPSSTGSRRKFTLSTWVKFNSGARRNIMAWKTDSNNAGEIRVEASGQVQVFEFQGGTQSNGFGLFSTRLLRDPSSWYNLFVSVDTTQGTSGLIMFINGEEITYDTRTLGGGTNLDCNFNLSGTPMKIGSDRDDGQVWDGYIAEMHWIDGTIKSHTDFGKFNDNGVWIPKEYDGTYGTNGFYLEFKQTGTGTNSSGMGADTSGNDNHFAVTNLSAEDVTTDTCTNNFATWNPLDPNRDNDLSEGNTQYVSPTSAREQIRSTFGLTSGKWYWETKPITSNAGLSVGILKENASMTLDDALGKDDFGWAYDSDGSSRHNNSSTSSGFDSYTTNDIIGVALDLDNYEIFFYKNGVVQNSGNKAFDLDTDQTYFAACGSNSNGSTETFQVNFGNAPYTISSGNSDSEGFGNFEFAVPSGYFALCTKNLAEYG